ncbi:MAG: hypothetical protein J6Q16_05260 [Clostridia bacterium]|nr:hypothetical protein [Clostridia bacterium]
MAKKIFGRGDCAVGRSGVKYTHNAPRMIDMEYIIKKADITSPALHSSRWDRAQVGHISAEPWPGFTGFSAPETAFRVLRDAEGLWVRFRTREHNLRAEVTQQNGAVCRDSCVEFFVSPDAEDGRYMNFELNPKGIMHIGLGKERSGRVLIEDVRSIFRVESDARDGDWSICWYVPDDFLLRYFGQISPVWRANFYKCGDHTDHPHYAVWNNVKTEKPDYHRPEFFGTLRVEE